MFRVPKNRRARFQLSLVLAFLALFAGTVWLTADYLRDTARNAALQEAVIANDVEEARRLLAEGADPNGRIGYSFLRRAEQTFYRPIEHAIDQGHLPMIKLLVDSGADLYIRYHHKDAFEEGWYERTALEWALRQCKTDAAHYLVFESGKLDLEREEVDLLLLLTAECGDVELAEYCIENGANPVTAAPPANPLDMHLPLHYAVMGGNVDVVRLLVEHGAHINAVSAAYPRGTPLDVAVKYGSFEVIELLLDLGADPNQMSYGYTPLHAAVYREDAEVVRLLLDRGANPSILDDEGTPPISYAHELKHAAITELLRGAEWATKEPG